MAYKKPKPYTIPPPTEAKIQAHIVKYLKHRGIPYYKTSAMHSRGWTDLVLCYRGMYVGLEVKRPNGFGKVTPIQSKHMDIIREADGFAYVVYCVDDVELYLKQVDKHLKEM